MPNVEKAFEDFATGLMLPGERLKATMESSEQVTRWIEQKLKVTGTLWGGSYRRGTGMPKDNLRLHLVLSSKHFYDCKENSTKMLNFLRNRLPGDCGETSIGGGGSVVKMKVASGVDLDLVPSIRLAKGGYLVPNGHGGWSKTNPEREETLFNNKDEISSGRFRKLAKIIKAWNLHAGNSFSPYFLELMVYYRVHDFVRPYAELVQSLFVSLRLFLPEFLNCPAVGEVISSGVPSGVSQKLVQEAYSLTGKAMSGSGVEKAVMIWKSLLGGKFGEEKNSGNV